LIKEYGLTNKTISYVKENRTNLFAMTNPFKSIVSFVDLGIHESFEGVCFGFAFLKAWQHATIDKKMSDSL
jgi:hypothetical protein